MVAIKRSVHTHTPFLYIYIGFWYSKSIMRISFIITAYLFLCTPLFVFAAQPGDILFSEIAYDLKGADDGHEWVEVRNLSTGDIDLTGWKFNDGANHVLNIPPKNGGQGTMVVPAGGYVVLAGDAEVFIADYPGFSGTVIDTVMSLGNTGATLTMIDADGAVIDTAIYAKETGAAGNGMTLERQEGGIWKESAGEGGTPGMGNSSGTDLHQQSETATTSSPSLDVQRVVSAPRIVADAGENVTALAGEEIIFDASGTQGGGGAAFIWNFGDGTIASGESIFHRYMFPGKYIVVLSVSGSEDTIEANIYPHGIAISEFMPDGGTGEKEWIEVHNDSVYSADLSQWGISTGDTKARFNIPQGTVLAAGGYMVLARDVSHIALPNEKGMITLWYPHGQQAMRVEYDHAKKGFSAARKSDGSYVWTDQRTPGARNVFVVSDTGDESGSPQAAAVREIDAHVPALRAAWERVHDDAGGSLRSFIAEPAHAMVYDEGASSVSPMNIFEPALAYSTFPFAIAALLGMAGGILGALIILKRKK